MQSSVCGCVTFTAESQDAFTHSQPPVARCMRDAHLTVTEAAAALVKEKLRIIELQLDCSEDADDTERSQQTEQTEKK